MAQRGMTIFSFGYWGWGNATEQLVQVVDAVERAGGFRPPLFVDIRISRSVRAKGFLGDAFRDTVGDSRYRWMPELGNTSVVDRTRGIRIQKPEAAETLFETALKEKARGRRVLFYCSCELPGLKGHEGACHRTTVAHLLLAEAGRRGRSLEVVEWPGGRPTRIDLDVPREVMKKLHAGQCSVPLPERPQLASFGALPWCSIANLHAGSEQMSVVTGPAKFDARGWHLPVLYAAGPDESASSLKREADRLRRKRGFRPH